MAKEGGTSLVGVLLLELLCVTAAASLLPPAPNASHDPAETSIEEFWWEVQTEVMAITAEMQTQCPEQEFTCLQNGSLAQHTSGNKGCSLCQCDPDCLLYGDCCADYAAAAALATRYDNMSPDLTMLTSGQPQQHGAEMLGAVVAMNVDAILSEPSYETDQDRPAFVCSALDFQATGVYMVGNCPRKFGDMNVKQLCQRQVSGAAYTYLVDMPVTSAVTNLTYVNYYCALCHADEHNLHTWNISIPCRGLSKGTSMQEFMLTAKYQPGLRMWHHIRPHPSGGQKKTICLLRVEEFSSAAHFIEQVGGRLCLEPKPICPAGDSSDKCASQVRECPETWTDKRVKEKCEQYSMLTLHRKITYRNPHCALCNGVNVTELSCSTTKGCVRKHKNIFLPQAFSTLMDFKSANCGDQDLYDPLSSKCYKVKCGNLFTLKSGVCVRDESVSLTAGVSYLNDSCAKVLFPKEEFVVSENDSSVTITASKKRYKWGRYELDENLNLLVCNHKYVYLSTITYPQKIVTFVVLMISVFCLTAHILIFWLFPKMRNLPGKNLCSLSFSLLMAHFLLLVGMQALWHSGICIIVAISLHYFWLASFCWMNVMSLDVFITFKGTVHRGSDGNTKTFLGYAAYSWGVPLLVILSALIVQFTDIMPEYKPQYNSGSLCWINNKDALILFFLMPIGVIILENVALFIVTSYGIYQQSKYSKFAKMRSQSIKKQEKNSVPKETKSTDSHKNKAERKDRIRFLLYIKLGIIQGLTWTTGFLAAITGLAACWYLFTVLNGLQGFFIFLSFDMKKKVWQSVHEKLTGKLWSFRSSRGTSTTTLTTATSSARRFQSNLEDAVCTETTQLDDDDSARVDTTVNARKFPPYLEGLKKVTRSAKKLFSKAELDQPVSSRDTQVERMNCGNRAMADDAPPEITDATRLGHPVAKSLQSSRNQKNCGSSDTVPQVEDADEKKHQKINNFHPQESRAVISNRRTNVEILDKNSSINGQNEDHGRKSLEISVKKSFEFERMKDFLKQLSQDNNPSVKHIRSSSDVWQANVSDQKTKSTSPDNIRPELKRSCSSRGLRDSPIVQATGPASHPRSAPEVSARHHESTLPTELNNSTQGKLIYNDEQQLQTEPKLIHRVKNQCGIQHHQ